jgi:hypothetical protein
MAKESKSRRIGARIFMLKKKTNLSWTITLEIRQFHPWWVDRPVGGETAIEMV